MKQIQQFYMDWLRRYCRNQADWTMSRILTDLSKNMPAAQSIEELIAVLTPYTQNPGDQEEEPIQFCYGPVGLYSTIAEWKNYLDKVVSDHQQAKQNLLLIKTTVLSNFLSKILHDRQALLHPKIASMLSIMVKNEFCQIIDYLLGLRHVEIRKSFRGSHNDLRAVDNLHQESIQLLNNVAGNFDEQNALWQHANTLLQNAIEVYKDLYGEPELVEIPLDGQSDNEVRFHRFTVKKDMNEGQCSIC